MATRRHRRAKDRRGWIVPILGVALIGVVAALWTMVHPFDRDRADSQVDEDLAGAIRRIAARREVKPSSITEDDPIRKEGGVFVRTWRLTGQRRGEVEALASDLVAEASRRGLSFERRHPGAGEVDVIRIDEGVEAFDIRLSVREVGGATRPSPTPKVSDHVPKSTDTAPARPSGTPGRIAILLDDAGQNMDLVAAAAELPVEVGFAVLPFLPASSSAADALHRAGHEIWLHLPMEPTGYPDEDPGAGAVFVTMPENQIRKTVHAAVDNVPHVVGVNNHMGSKATTDLRTMTWVMQELKGRGLFFIDSRTAVDTVAEAAARVQGVPTGRRHVFLDNDRTAAAISSQLDEVTSRALAGEGIIAIGHFAPVTIAVLRARCPTIRENGVELVRPSLMVR